MSRNSICTVKSRTARCWPNRRPGDTRQASYSSCHTSSDNVHGNMMGYVEAFIATFSRTDLHAAWTMHKRSD